MVVMKEVNTKLVLVPLDSCSQNDIVWHDTSWRGMVFSPAHTRQVILLRALALLYHGDCCI